MSRFRSRSRRSTKRIHRLAVVACGVFLIFIAPAALAQYGLKTIEKAVDATSEAVEAATCDDTNERRRRRCEREAEARVEVAARRDEKARRASREYHRRLARDLAADDTPRSLALAALLLTDAVGEGDAAVGARARDDASTIEARRWREAARRRASDDPVVVLLTLGREASASADDAAIAYWRAVDPNNLAPWMYDLSGEIAPPASAVDAESPLRDDFFEAARAADRFDLYFDDIAREVVLGVRRHPPKDSARAALFAPDYPTLDAYAYGLATALWASAGMPRFMPLVQACKGEALQATLTRAADCRAIATTMRARSDTLIGRLFGIAVARRAAADDAERLRIANERRREDWRSAQWREATRRDPEGTSSATIARLLERADVSEMALMDAAIAWADLSLEPPSDWDSGYRFPDEREAAEPSP